MKKNIIFILSLCTLFAHAMEKENRWSITAYGTKINLNKADILEYYADDTKKEDVVIVVGQYKQEELGEVPLGGTLPGECWEQKTVRFTSKEGSVNRQKAWSNTWCFPQREGITFLVVTEPRVFNFCSEAAQYWYDDCECYTNELAVKESCKDLLRCYHILLDKGLELLKDKKVKNIALPMLGADFHNQQIRMFKSDAIPIAVNAVLECIKNKRGAYDTIEFCVEEDADFNVYKELLIQRKNEEQNVLLVYFAQKDFENIFAMLPCELIHYIAQLI